MTHSTDNYIAEYIVNRLYPSVKNGIMQTIHDPAMGDGGFLFNTVKYLQENKPDINWEVNKLNISGCEIDRNIYFSTLQNLYYYTGIDFTNTIICYDSIKILDSIRRYASPTEELEGNNGESIGDSPLDSHILLNQIHNKYDIIMVDHGDSKQPVIQFIKYTMKMLNYDGRAAFIIKDKYLTSNKRKYIKIRRKLLSRFNLHHVVSINDHNKKSILFFDNNGPTDNVEFFNIIYSDNNIMEMYDTTISHEQIAFNYYHINSYKNHVMIDNIIIDSNSESGESDESSITQFDALTITSLTSEDEETILSNTIDLLKL
jgi:type I restriction-modification system DNA methylase subunit